MPPPIEPLPSETSYAGKSRLRTWMPDRWLSVYSECAHDSEPWTQPMRVSLRAMRVPILEQTLKFILRLRLAAATQALKFHSRR